MRHMCPWILAGHMIILVHAAAFAQAENPAPPLGRQVNRTPLWERTGRDILHGFCNMYNFHCLQEPGAEFPYRAWFFGWAAADGNRNIPGHTGCDAIFAARVARGAPLDGPWQVYAGDSQWDDTMTPARPVPTRSKAIAPGWNGARWRPVISAQNVWYDEWHNGDP